MKRRLVLVKVVGQILIQDLFSLMHGKISLLRQVLLLMWIFQQKLASQQLQ
jgi:hypothetical protein